MSPHEQPSITAEIDDVFTSAGVQASDPDYIVVQSSWDLERLADDILGARDRPIVGLTYSLDECEPVLRSADVRAVVGPGVRIYLVAEEDLLVGLQEILGPRLRLDSGSARIWWPDVGPGCDPADHPAVIVLDGESRTATLEEFASQFDLSRPRVRRCVKVIEDARAFLEHELALVQEHNHKANERLRDAQIECHRLRTRAEVAEASLLAARSAAEAE